jgi:hypothetical protein
MEQGEHRTLHRVRIAGSVLTTAVECYVLLEVFWYYTHSEDETLREAIAEWWDGVVTRARERNHVRQTVDMIRDLPETDNA